MIWQNAHFPTEGPFLRKAFFTREAMMAPMGEMMGRGVLDCVFLFVQGLTGFSGQTLT